jgi:hypothetical protein
MKKRGHAIEKEEGEEAAEMEKSGNEVEAAGSRPERT